MFDSHDGSTAKKGVSGMIAKHARELREGNVAMLSRSLESGELVYKYGLLVKSVHRPLLATSNSCLVDLLLVETYRMAHNGGGDGGSYTVPHVVWERAMTRTVMYTSRPHTKQVIPMED